MSLLKQAMDTTAKLTAFVVFILVGARVFSLTFYGVNGHVWVEELLTGLPGGQLGFLIVVNLLVFFLAFFLDFFELSFIVIPLLGPVAEKLGIDLIWFGVLLGVNMQTSFMHPPFGFALFYLRSVAPVKEYRDKITGKMMAPITTMQIYWGAVPFVLIQVLMVAIVILFPQMVMVYKSDASTVDPSKIQIIVPQDAPATGVGRTGSRAEPTEQQKSDTEDEAAQVAAGRVQGDDARRSGRRRRGAAQVAQSRAAKKKAPHSAGLFSVGVAARGGDRLVPEPTSWRRRARRASLRS